MNIQFKPVLWGINPEHRKEKHFCKEIAVISKKDENKTITCRFYKTEGYWYCCVWIEDINVIYASGSAKQHSFHDAMNVALKSCGITMPEFCDNEKENFIELARFIFHEDDFIFHVAHG